MAKTNKTQVSYTLHSRVSLRLLLIDFCLQRNIFLKSTNEGWVYFNLHFSLKAKAAEGCMIAQKSFH